MRNGLAGSKVTAVKISARGTPINRPLATAMETPAGHSRRNSSLACVAALCPRRPSDVFRAGLQSLRRRRGSACRRLPQAAGGERRRRTRGALAALLRRWAGRMQVYAFAAVRRCDCNVLMTVFRFFLYQSCANLSCARLGSILSWTRVVADGMR